MNRLLFDPNLPLGRYQIRYRGQVIVDSEMEPDVLTEAVQRAMETDNPKVVEALRELGLLASQRLRSVAAADRAPGDAGERDGV